MVILKENIKDAEEIVMKVYKKIKLIFYMIKNKYR